MLAPTPHVVVWTGAAAFAHADAAALRDAFWQHGYVLAVRELALDDPAAYVNSDAPTRALATVAATGTERLLTGADAASVAHAVAAFIDQERYPDPAPVGSLA